jgi:hypothetical protein
VYHTTRLNCPATARRPRFQVSNPLSTAAARWPDSLHSMADMTHICY